MKRFGTHISMLSLLVMVLSACRGPQNAVTAQPTLTAAASQPTAVQAWPTSTSQPDLTNDPTAMRTPIPNSRLLDILRTDLGDKLSLAAFDDDGLGWSGDKHQAFNLAFETWSTDWLNQFKAEGTDPALQLDDYELQKAGRWDFAEGWYDVDYATASFALKPTAGNESLWLRPGQEVDDAGWFQHDGLVFSFSEQDTIFTLANIYLNWPQDTRLIIDAAEAEGLTEADLARYLMTYWLAGYESDDLVPDMQLKGYTIDDVTLHQVQDQQARFNIKFSINLAAQHSFYWTDGRFSGFEHNTLDWFEDDNILDWINGMIRYVGVRRDTHHVYLETLDRPWPETPRVDDAELVTGTPEEIGRLMIERWLSGYFQPEITNCGKLLEYKIEGVSFIEERDGYIVIGTSYSVKPYQMWAGPSIRCVMWNAGSGEPNFDTGWIEHQTVYVRIKDMGDYYVFDEAATGGPMIPEPD